MKFLTVSLVAAGLGVLPMTAAFAQGSGSDVPPATTKAAVAGASTTTGTVTTYPQSGTNGGGMTTGSGRKVGGMDKVNPIKTAGAAQ